MFVRKKKNKSGIISVQIIDKSSGKYKLHKTIGSSADKKVIEELYAKANEEIRKLNRQEQFSFEIETERQLVDTFYNSIEDFKLLGPELLLGKVLGLLANAAGFPLGYEIFDGKKFEGHTMLPVIETFKKRYKLKHLVIVADAGLMSKENNRSENKE